jgi:hypothetical protein
MCVQAESQMTQVILTGEAQECKQAETEFKKFKPTSIHICNYNLTFHMIINKKC